MTTVMAVRMSLFHRFRVHQPLFAALIAVSGATGCGHMIAEIPKKALPATIDAGLNKVDETETQRKMLSVVRSPEMKAIEKELISGLLDGTLNTLSEEERSERIGALLTKAMAGMMGGVSKNIGPMTSKMTSSAVGGALDAALQPGRREALAESVGAMVSTTVRSATEGMREAELSESIATGMSEQIGPAMQKVLRENLAPGIGEALKNEELRRELGMTARILGREMVAGITEGLAQAQPAKGDGSLLARISTLAGQGARLFGSAAWLLALVIVALAVWVVRLWAQARRYREDAHRREAATRLLEEAARAAEGKPWSNELMSVLKERLSSQDGDREAAERERKARKRFRLRKSGPPTDQAGRPRPSLA